MDKKIMLSHEATDIKGTLNQTIRIGSSTIEFYEEESTKSNEELKNVLTKMYDVSNKIARNAEKRGVDTSNWFYTSKQINSMKKQKGNLFI